MFLAFWNRLIEAKIIFKQHHPISSGFFKVSINGRIQVCPPDEMVAFCLKLEISLPYYEPLSFQKILGQALRIK